MIFKTLFVKVSVGQLFLLFIVLFASLYAVPLTQSQTGLLLFPLLHLNIDCSLQNATMLIMLKFNPHFELLNEKTRDLSEAI